jgi:ParB-like chromosome segregation protein Spo0J
LNRAERTCSAAKWFQARSALADPIAPNMRHELLRLASRSRLTSLSPFRQEHSNKQENIVDICDVTTAISAFLEPLDGDEKIEAINQIREAIHRESPFAAEPVDFVRWVKNDLIKANDYNPNSVAPPEMELLRLSIMNDGYTQPIVTFPEDGLITVIDGFHRNRVGKECADVRERIHGYLPVVRINPSQEDRNDRIAATIRHNRARGKHNVQSMSDIVIELKKRNWSDARIAKELGMDADEVLRLCQVSGLAEVFGDGDFSMAWDAAIEAEEDIEIAFEEEMDDAA